MDGKQFLYAVELLWRECVIGVHVKLCAYKMMIKASILIYSCQIPYIITSTMPRVNNHKQKNKRFKGTARAKAKTPKSLNTSSVNSLSKNKRIHKISKLERVQAIKNKQVKHAEKLRDANQYLDKETKQAVTQRLKIQKQEVRIVLMVPCNSKASTQQLMNMLGKYVQGQSTFTLRTQLPGCNGFPAFQVFPNGSKSILKNGIFVIASNQDPRQLIDLAKSADIVCPVISALSANPQKIVEDPFNYGGAFDEAGYTTINLLRSLGLPKVVGLVQHLQQIQHRHHDRVQKFYKRFLVSEFGEEKCISVQKQGDMGSLLRVLDSCGLIQQFWKQQRGYFLADHVEKGEGNSIVLGGYLKGSCINANQLVHLTGFDDYQIQKIQIQDFKAKVKAASMEQQGTALHQFSTLAQNLDPFSKPETQEQHGDILSAIEGLKLQPQVQQNKNESESQEKDMEQDQMADQDEQWQSQSENNEQMKIQEKTKRIDMVFRKQDQLQFQDQVQYTAQQKLRQKFRFYQGLKSFKTSSWNQLENLPNQYDRIYFFKNYNQTYQAALKDNLARGFAYPGFYVKITIKDFNASQLQGHQLPLIASFLLKHERKMTVLHGKVQRNSFYQGSDQLSSGELVMVSLGFKRIIVKPVLSRCINGTQKTKYAKKIGLDYENYYFCSFYGLNYFPTTPFLVFRINQFYQDQVEGAPILRGMLAKCDPMHIILQRIILTGYPYKIYKRRSTVRFMFFNPSDVKYFRPVEVRTRLGLRGKIEQSLGTHGLMKCLFNDPVKHNDTVCMHLYRRVFPEPGFQH